MADDPLHFGDDGAQVFGAIRHRDVHELFNRTAVGEVVVHGTHVVEPVRVRNELMVGAFLGELFDSAVQETHDGRGFNETLAFQFQNHLQHAVRARMLRSHVEQQLLRP